MNPGGSISLVVKPAGPPGEALDQALRAAGFLVRVAPTVFDAVTEAQRAGGVLKYLFVGVDHWGPREFRLLPLVRREWPATSIVACHSPGFAYKGRLAELIGADAVLGSTEEILQFVEGIEASAELAPAPEEASIPEPAAQTVEPPPAAEAEASALAEAPPPVPVAAPPAPAQTDAAPPQARPIREPPPAPPQATRQPVWPEAARPFASPLQSIPMIRPPPRPPEPAPAPPADPPAPAQPGPVGPGDEDLAGEDGIDGEVIGTIELTEEELRLLLGEDEEA